MEEAWEAPAGWDFDSDEIASINSQDLHDNRPNRWRGPKSSWRTLTADERLLWRSMQQLQHQDLSVHLYDVFALRRQGEDMQTTELFTVKTASILRRSRCMWTAWPLKESHVPQETLLKIGDNGDNCDDDGQLTLRMNEKANNMPSSRLQDEIGATILRLAKESFLKRTRRESAPIQPSIESTAAGTAAETDDEISLPSSPPLSIKMEPAEVGDMTQLDSVEPHSRSSNSKNPNRPAPRTHEPTVSTDDDLSYALLRPSVRNIILQLDKTLTILHNARVAGLHQLSDSSTDSDSGSQSAAAERPQKRPRGRPRRTPQAGESTDEGDRVKLTRRGRPRKQHVPRVGETQVEMRHRIAREGHRRLPVTEEEKEAAFEEWLRKGDLQRQREREMDAEMDGPFAVVDDGTAGEVEDGQHVPLGNVERKLLRWGLRDWSDVVGAAALAGVSEEVIKRTTRRCANLFGQGMTIRRLDEAIASHGPGFRTLIYQPERISLSSSASRSSSFPSSSSDEVPTLNQRRLASHSRSPSASRRGRTSLRLSASAASTSRSRSRSSAGLIFCPVPRCDRAAMGFSRRANLSRHMHLVHPDIAEDGGDSDDDTVGAVHVDGFLRPVQMSRGWRGEDVAERKRKRFYAGRETTPGRSRTSPRSNDDGDDDYEAGDESARRVLCSWPEQIKKVKARF
ncbi:hypothetical protein RJ55_05817 [Drechmeria coniospora]|nr:hypothetical protein RJ55_05817 [Drechmeria coniospora]